MKAILLGMLIGFSFGAGLIATVSEIKAEHINTLCGTHLTADDVFWTHPQVVVGITNGITVIQNNH